MKQDPRAAWHREGKLGLFLHWGPYSVAGVEASWPIMVPELSWLAGQPRISEADYLELPARFNPTGFDPDAWVRAAREAGMRYIVLTSKHHDGFCMFDAPGTEYKITRGPYGKDIVAALAQACERAGMPFGLYYSPPDVHHPGYRDTSRPVRENWFGEPERPSWKEYLDTMEEQLTALLTRYGRISILWFDGLFDQEKYDPARFHRLVRRLGPDTLVNDRLGEGGDYVTPEQGVPASIPVRPTPEHPRKQTSTREFLGLIRLLRIPLVRGALRLAVLARSRAGAPLESLPTSLLPTEEEFQPWESCLTMGSTWGYFPGERRWKSVDQLIRTLYDVASKGGNLLLNVGPAPDGTFPTEALERLRGLGVWLRSNGEAIYGSSYGRPQGVAGLRVTERSGYRYVGVLKVPRDRILRLDAAGGSTEPSILATGERLQSRRSGDALEIDLPETAGLPSLPVVRIRSSA